MPGPQLPQVSLLPGERPNSAAPNHASQGAIAPFQVSAMSPNGSIDALC